MKKRTGIWIDTTRAVIISLENESHNVKTVYSDIEGRVRIPGESKEFTRMGDQFISMETRKENRVHEQKNHYLKDVLHELTDTEELVVFGPAEMKTELKHEIEKDHKLAAKLKSVETTDSMTDNQMVAWVKKYYGV